MKSFLTSFSAVFAAVAASTCCVGPLLALAGFMGVSASQIIWLSSIKNYLVFGSLIIISYNLYRAYYPKKNQECCSIDEDSTLTKKESKLVAFFQSKRFLWSIAIMTLFILILPFLS